MHDWVIVVPHPGDVTFDALPTAVRDDGDIVCISKHSKRPFLLTGKHNHASTLWELRDAVTGAVLSNQLDLPLACYFDLPLTWAQKEMTRSRT